MNNNNNNEEMIKRLSFENLIWVSFIIISILDIYGDELIKKDLRYNDKKSLEKANKLFLGITLFTILIYIYFLIRNYSDYEKYKNQNYEVRLIGSVLILAGSLCLLYFQINNTRPVDSPSNI